MSAEYTPVYVTKLVREGEIEIPVSKIYGPDGVAELLDPVFRESPVEIFVVVMLNMGNKVLGVEVVSKGGLAASIVEPRGVFRAAILANAASIICAHNHPSGNKEPSCEDIAVTRQLVEAGAIMGIPLRDHVIWTHDGYSSFARRGLI